MSRALVFAVVLFALRFAVGVLVGAGDGASGSQIVHRYVLEYVLDSAIVIAVFARLAAVQVASPWRQALFVVALEEVFGAVFSVAVFHDVVRSPLWMFDYLVLALSLSVGMWIGQKFAYRVRESRDKRDSA